MLKKGRVRGLFYLLFRTEIHHTRTVKKFDKPVTQPTTSLNSQLKKNGSGNCALCPRSHLGATVPRPNILQLICKSFFRNFGVVGCLLVHEYRVGNARNTIVLLACCRNRWSILLSCVAVERRGQSFYPVNSHREAPRARTFPAELLPL